MAGDWTLLARKGGDTSVFRCPEGHIHLEYGSTSLKLESGHFLELAGVVCAAARKLGDPVAGCERLSRGGAAGPFGAN